VVSEGIDATVALDHSVCLVRLARLLIATDRLRHELRVVCGLLYNDASGVADVRAEELLAHGHDHNAGRSRESDVQSPTKEGFVSI
jgi:hypothetical protein